MTVFARRRTLGPKKEDITVRDMVGVLLWFLLVSLSIEFALKWPWMAVATPTFSEKTHKNELSDNSFGSSSLLSQAMALKNFLPDRKVTTPNYDLSVERKDKAISFNTGDLVPNKNFDGEGKTHQNNADHPGEKFKFWKTPTIKTSEKEAIVANYNSLHLSGKVIPLTAPEAEVLPSIGLPAQSATHLLPKRVKREKKNEVKHVLKVTYDFIHPRIMTPTLSVTRSHKRNANLHAQSQPRRAEPQIFDSETPSVKFNYNNNVKFHGTGLAHPNKRTEEATTEIGEHAALDNVTSGAAAENISEKVSTDKTVAANEITEETRTPMKEVEGNPASFSLSKGTPRSSDPETDALHMTTVTFDPSVIVTIPPGQFDTMDFDVPGEPLTPEDYQKAALAQDEPIDTSRQVDPTTTAEQFEGDIKLVEDDKPINKTALQGLPTFRSGIVSSERLWPNGNVPYVLSSTFRPEERSIIAKAVKTLHDLSCVHLVPHTNERDYIHILKGDGCTSNIGRVGGSQALSLGPGCIKAGVVMHELMHALGFWHEQSRFDRDRYININWDNIQKGKGYNFQKYDFKGLQHVGTQYDFESLMHYSPYAFAKNRSVPTVEPKHGQHEVGQRRGLSSNDLHRLMELYPCPNATSPANFPNVHMPTATLPPPVPGLCVDSDKHCAKWALEGQCTENPAWMMLHCRQSCNRCAESQCVDLNTKCGLWKADGQCEANAPYMHLYCSRSCQLCSGADQTTVACTNSNKKCGLWASQGDCVRYPGYMNRYCRKSCLQC